MAFPENIQSNTPAKYLFKLIGLTDYVICEPEPLEWKSGYIEYKRDLDNGGVFVSFICDSLTFVGNGAQFLKNLYEAYEINAKCTLIIYWWKNSTREYVQFPTRYDINFNFYEKVKIGRFFAGVKIKAVNSSTQTKLDNRQDVDVDITKLVTIGGVTIKDYPNLKKQLNYDETNVFYHSELSNCPSLDNPVYYDENTVDKFYFAPHGSWALDRKKNFDSYTSIPLTIIANDIPEIQNVNYVNQVTDLLSVPSLLKNAQFDKEFTIHYSFVVRVTDDHTGTYPWNIQLLEVSPSGEIMNTWANKGFGGLVKVYNLFDTLTGIRITKGNDLKFVVRVANIKGTKAYLALSSVKITQTIANSPATTTEGFPILEAIERVCQHDLDVQYPVYSDFFGRQDVQYADGKYYSSENQERFAHIQTGMNQRGAKLYDESYPVALNFKDLFKTIKSIWNVGYSLEINFSLFGDYQPRIRIEDYAYFFQNTEIVLDPPLSERITKYDIQSVVMPELVPVDIKSGFDSFEYLSINGLAEPNTTNQRTSIMSTSTKLENISPIRADTKGITDNLSNPIGTDSGSTDTKGDSSLFIVKTQKDGDNWKPEKGEYISVENNSSLFKEELLNRFFTPTRMLLRHGNRISAGMTKYTDSKLIFQKSDKSNSLQTSDDSGVTIIKENADILVSSLGNPIFKAMKHTINVEFTKKDLETIQLNPLGYLVFSNTISGFLLNLKMKNNEDRADLSIIERYIP